MLSELTPVAVLSVIVVFFAIAWALLNAYIYYPVVRSAISRITSGTSTWEAAIVGTDRITVTDEDSYPEIDVFVPGYKEQDVIHQSIKSIRQTNYPQEKLNLTVLLEPDDTETIARVRELAEQIDLDLITVPDGYPGSPNKPRALNYGFEQTTGDVVGIIDAENVVAKDLFDRVAKGIVGEGHDYVQGRVDMVNEDDGWKNLLFRAEYGYWYRFILPAFKRIGFAIPLSGTTCFFRREVLTRASDTRRSRKGTPWDRDDVSWLADHGLSGITPWDPNNVTEDFELGLQLWCTDFSFGFIDSATKEESPQSLENWMKQRTRWQKGKLYTFFDFLKNGVSGSSKQRRHLLWLSFLPFYGLLNVVGILLLLGVGPIVGFTPSNQLIVGMLLFSAAFLVVGAASFGVGYWRTSKKPAGTKTLRAVFVMATTPFYWLLQWGADIRAIKQLAVGDLGWEKTIHEDAGRLKELQQEPAETDSLPRVVRAKAMNHILLAPILLLALALRIPGLDRGYWVDEIYTIAERGQMDLVTIVTTNSDPHPPLYYLLVRIWMEFFGNGAVAIRSLSVLFGLASIVAVYLLALELYDKQTGQIAALLMSISWFQIQHALTARMYTLLVTLSVLSMYFYIRTLGDHSVENRLGYAVITLGMLLTHVYGVFVLMAQIIHLSYKLFSWADVARLKKWAVTQTMAFGFFMPWIGLVAVPNYVLGPTDEAETSWLTEPSIWMIETIGLAMAGVPVNYPTVTITDMTLIFGRLFAVLAVAAVVWHVYRETKTDDGVGGATLLAALLVCFTLVPFAISVTIVPMLEARYTIVGFVAIAILIAKTVSDVDYAPARVTILLVVVVLMAAMLPTAYAATSAEDWEGATEIAEPELDESSLIVYNPAFTAGAFEHYLDEEINVETDGYQWEGDGGELRELISESGHDQVLIVNVHEQDLGAVEEELPSEFQHTETKSAGVINLLFYERSTTETANQQLEGEQ